KWRRALKAVNAKLKEFYPESEELFKVLLIGDSSLDSFNKAVRKHGEWLTHPQNNTGTFTEGFDSINLISSLSRTNTHLYLSAEPGLRMVQEALSKGKYYTLTTLHHKNIKTNEEDQLRVVFDGDAVLFSNESERVFQRDGFLAYLKNEQENVEIPMNEVTNSDKGLYRNCPIRTYLVTSRGAGSDGYRALNTLRMWGLELDEAVCVGGTGKGPTLDKIRPHIFFDDQQRHIKAALEVGTVACLLKACFYHKWSNNGLKL
uniref:5'-nucleotidase n=1 Tax=Acanthochromis polyacanthus TaxID=80966 RepID=A0A3Q1EWE6_9TELE